MKGKARELRRWRSRPGEDPGPTVKVWMGEGIGDRDIFAKGFLLGIYFLEKQGSPAC
jgi:hypothetical protein